MSGDLVLRNIGTVFEPTGYAKANRHVLLELANRGVSARFSPIHPESVRVKLDPSVEARLHSLAHTPLPERHIVLFHYPGIHFHKDPHQFSIGMTMFECSRLPFTWVRRCSMMDEIWVPSHFNRSTFSQSGVPLHKIQVMPYGIDPGMFCPGKPPLPIAGRRSYAFLCVCSFDGRKGLDVLLTSFFEEFAETEDVCLILKTRASTQEEIGRQQAYIDSIAVKTSGQKRSSAILLSTTYSWTEEELAMLYNCANSYVLPTRGEGWNMTVMEAMASGLPVITTRWSAHLDFVNDMNGYLISVQRFIPFHSTNKRLMWADPDKQHLKQLMRHVYIHREEAAAKAALGRQTVSGHYTWEACAARMHHRLLEISAR
ncbi:glycosyltransferase family 4 protein [Paenibacillus alvei]|uniref:glycosyltransferase family 4 protein n=1 Tax=Paenibacillus alvei TaxID=44250 RepID=UPI0018CE0177|nr:glycosyltransferase family 4 protein [Paenibacillus alvei]MBG9736818.1 glycosyl transferase family 2 [Paenibacillus alvei]MBG9746974.1 glycosyl transferase family 2 [Paenibacillus alvei]MCY9582001.1 glycosyltransferase family 4 protein [Paenibacillus alvei]MCY9585899.1 glycosyltransferase family 4 protein [Paenibacillus alvei]